MRIIKERTGSRRYRRWRLGVGTRIRAVGEDSLFTATQYPQLIILSSLYSLASILFFGELQKYSTAGRRRRFFSIWTYSCWCRLHFGARVSTGKFGIKRIVIQTGRGLSLNAINALVLETVTSSALRSCQWKKGHTKRDWNRIVGPDCAISSG